MSDRITIEGRDGAFGAYISRPKALPAPAVVVLHEVFGVNADIRKICDELAEQGFIAVAPDLFWRQEPDVDLSLTSEPDWQHGLCLYQAYDRDAGATDVKDTAIAVAKLPECIGRVAILGAAALANGRTIEFLHQQLRRPSVAPAVSGDWSAFAFGHVGAFATAKGFEDDQKN